MAINTTPKEMPTGGGNPTAGAINISDHLTTQNPGKAFATPRATLALPGQTLRRTEQAEGPATYWVERWGLVRHLPYFHDVAIFLAQIGGRL